ncbi:MAG: sensor histidine kinase [Cytophagales bacterium]|nr:MAG: sensor histidine kinase [Cytophagales bacterium]
MSIALLGLAFLQIYWLSQVLQANKERFEQNVQIALKRITERLEAREAFYNAQRQIQRINTNPKIYISLDSINNIYQHHIVGQKRGRQTFIQKTPLETRKDFKTVLWSDIPQKEEVAFSVKNNVLPQDIQAQQLVKIARKSDMVALVINEMVNVQPDINRRLTSAVLDSIINTEFCNSGIKVPYEFGVLTPKKEFIFCNQNTDSKTILTKGHKISLFPNDVFTNTNMLYIYFPTQNDFIFGETMIMFLLTGLLMATIIACFAYAVHIILKQKKLSDITNDFISNMTHEFKTPVATVSLAAEALQDPDINNIPNLQNRYLNIIRNENKRLGTQIEKVLQTARLEKQDFELNLQRLNIEIIIQQCIQAIELQVEERGGTITWVQNAKQTLLEADEVHLKNIISNLLDNANKYSNDQPEIKIETSNNERGIKISISDKGQGIAKEQISKIFDKFYRIPTGNIHNVKGFGLGLNYVKAMTDAHKGSVSVKSEINKGSTFTLFFPYEQKS